MQNKGKLSEQALKARREYQRQWRAANPDKVKAKNDRYWEKKARLAADRQREQEHEQTDRV